MTSTVGGVLLEQAQARGESLFLWSGDDRISFGELADRAVRLAGGLAEIGVQRGDRVAILSPNRTEVLELYFACALLGSIQVPLNAFLKGEFLRYQLADSEAGVLVTDEAGVSAVAPLLAELPTLKHLVLFGGGAAAGLGAPVSPYRDVADGPPLPVTSLDSSHLMTIGYTSGTTGDPKGCMLSHEYYLRVASVMAECWRLGADDVLFSALPMFHGACRMMVVAAGLRAGLPTVVEPAFKPASFMARAGETQATVVMGVGAMGVAVLDQPPAAGDRAHRLRLVSWIPFPPAAQERFQERFGVEVLAEIYGQTECVPVTFNPPDGLRNRASAGSPAPDLELALLDDQDRPVKPGEIGEIALRPRAPGAMFLGYWRRPEDTLQAFRSLWYHTGDFGRMTDDGCVHFVDRKKDAIRRRGENVSSMQLEQAIAAHPKLSDAAVHGVPSAMTEEDIKALVVVRPGEAVAPAELFAFFRENLPYFAIPRYVEVIDSLPKNAVGRVMKHVLRERGITAETWDLEQLGLTVARAERR